MQGKVKNLSRKVLKEIPKGLLKQAKKSGIEESSKRSATFFQADHKLAYTDISKFYQGKLEIMDVREALRKYAWLRKYMWKIVDKNKDKFTLAADKNLGGGYFIRIFKKQEVVLPLQSCLMITKEGFKQNVHNIIISEEGSTAHIIAGCISEQNIRQARHVGISEFFVKKNALMNFTMIHTWGPETLVRPRSGAIVEDNATFVSNYICVQAVKDIQMYPVAYLNGKNSLGRFTSLLFASGKGIYDVGGKCVLNGKGSGAEIISRVIAKDKSKVASRGMLIGNTPDSKGHLECSGLLLSEKAQISAVPELIANKSSDLSHEAAVGKIAEKELVYLMSRGLSKEEATSTIIRGFLDTKILGLPQNLQRYIDHLMEQIKSASG
ncbi:MAG: SufD family Fe-S cluster assembly protein [Candidatus Woesearchaeota archaeon]